MLGQQRRMQCQSICTLYKHFGKALAFTIALQVTVDDSPRVHGHVVNAPLDIRVMGNNVLLSDHVMSTTEVVVPWRFAWPLRGWFSAFVDPDTPAQALDQRDAYPVKDSLVRFIHQIIVSVSTHSLSLCQARLHLIQARVVESFSRLVRQDLVRTEELVCLWPHLSSATAPLVTQV